MQSAGIRPRHVTAAGQLMHLSARAMSWRGSRNARQLVVIVCLDHVAAGYSWNDDVGLFLLWGMNVTSQEGVLVFALKLRYDTVVTVTSLQHAPSQQKCQRAFASPARQCACEPQGAQCMRSCRLSISKLQLPHIKHHTQL